MNLQSLRTLSSKADSKWNGDFDFWKFVSAIYILLLHSYVLFGNGIVCKQGYLAVELFLIITGFLFAQSVARDERPFSLRTIGLETAQFLARKIRSILPYYIVGYVLVFLSHAHQFASLRFLIDATFDFLFLREHGVTATPIQGINWYLACMFSVLFVLYPVFRWRKEFFTDMIAPVLAIVLIGNLFAKYGTIAAGIEIRWGFVSSNLIRAMGEICLGVFAWRLSEWLKNAKLNHTKVLAYVGFLSAVIAFSLISFGYGKTAMPLVILLFFVFACISGAGFRLVGDILPQSICRWLGKISMVLFLTHTAVRRFLVMFAKRIPRLQALFDARDTMSIAISLALYLFLCFALAIGCMVVWDAICARRTKTRLARQTKIAYDPLDASSTVVENT